MIEATATTLGMVIGFAIGAAFMAWMGAEDARALFFRKRKKRPGLLYEHPQRLIDRVMGVDKRRGDPMKHHGGGHYSRPVDFKADIPSCPICHGCGSVKSISEPSGEVPCTCKLLRDVYEDSTVELTLEQSRAAAARARGESPEAYVTVRVEDIVQSRVKQTMERQHIETMRVPAQVAANLTGKTFKVPGMEMRPVFHEEGDPNLRDEFGHLLEGRGPITIRTYGPVTGRLSSSGSNFRPRADEITEHRGPDEPDGEDESERTR